MTETTSNRTDSSQAPLTEAKDTAAIGGRTYSLLGYDADGRAHYHLDGEATNREHVVRVDGDHYRTGWLSDAQADEYQQQLHEGFQ